MQDLTYGNAKKGQEMLNTETAREQKTTARWAALRSLFQSTGAPTDGGLVSSKVRQNAKREAVGISSKQMPILEEDDGSGAEAGTAASSSGGAAAAGEGQAENSDEVAFPGDGDGDEPPEILSVADAAVVSIALTNPKRVQRQSSIITLLSPQEREHFHVKEKDHHLMRVAKLAHLEDQFGSVLSDTTELKTLWYDADNNANGDLSLTEWQSYARDKFNVLSNNKANRRAYNETAVAPEDVNPGGSRPASQVTKGSGLSMPVLNRSNFRLFLQRTFEYNKVWYAFQHLDTSNDDRVNWEEYVTLIYYSSMHPNVCVCVSSQRACMDVHACVYCAPRLENSLSHRVRTKPYLVSSAFNVAANNLPPTSTLRRPSQVQVKAEDIFQSAGNGSKILRRAWYDTRARV